MAKFIAFCSSDPINRIKQADRPTFDMRVNVDFPPNAQWKTDRIIMDISVMLILYYCSIVIGESFDFKSVLFSI